MKAFLAIKYYSSMKNKETIEQICKELEKKGMEVFAFARNIQNYGKCDMTGKEVMNLAFKEIESSDVFIIDASELSIGIGVEAGYAYVKGVPVYVIAKENSDVSESIKGISEKCFFYKTFKEISRLNF